MINLKVKRLTDTAKLPTYAHDGDEIVLKLLIQ